MKEIKLLSLALENFKGAKNFTFTPGGHNASVFGDNGTGKTTLADAFWWLLTAKDSLGRADYEIKTILNGEVQHGLEHSVTGEFLVDGQKITFRRTYKERWVKKKGAADAEFSGHETEYAVDGAPVQKTEYEAAIANAFGLNPKVAEETIFLLSHPQYFSETLHWERRRKLLMGICGDLTLEEVCRQTPELAALPGLLGNRTPDDGRKVAAEASKRLNQEMKELPARIDEIQRQIPATVRKIEAIKGDLAQAQAELDSAKNASADDAVRRELAALETEIAENEATVRAAAIKAGSGREDYISGLKKKLTEVLVKDEECSTIRRFRERQIKDLTAALASNASAIQVLLDKHAREEVEKFPEANITGACPSCGQSLPEEKIAEARRINSERMEAWGREKEATLERIKAEGQRLRAEESKLSADLLAAQEEKARLSAELKLIAADHAAAKEAVRLAEAEPAVFSESVSATVNKLQSLRGRVAEIKAGTANANSQSKSLIEGLNARIAALNAELGQVETAARLNARLADLIAGKREAAKEYDRQQRIVSLVEVFIRRKAQLLESAINKTFRTARFQLFKEQINEGIKECLETMVDGVPYGGLNHAMKIQAGMEIIDVLGENLGLRFPVWVDQRESITALPKIEAQVIDLVVSESDKQLKIQVKE